MENKAIISDKEFLGVLAEFKIVPNGADLVINDNVGLTIGIKNLYEQFVKSMKRSGLTLEDKKLLAEIESSVDILIVQPRKLVNSY